MTAISFKLSKDEASSLRRQAHEAHVTVSAFLRDLISKKTKKKEAPRFIIKYNKITGTPVISSTQNLPTFTTEQVKEMLADFP